MSVLTRARRRLRDLLEVGVYALAIRLARTVPIGTLLRLGERLGSLAHAIDRKRRSLALANLSLAYGDEFDAAGRERIVRGVYRHLGRLFFEDLAFLARPDLRPASRWVEFDDLEPVREVLERHGAAIFVTLHQGNWELLGGAASERIAPLHAVMRPLRNRLLNSRVVALREGLGLQLVQRADAVATLFRCLRRGQSIALLCDLDQKSSPAFVDFFGVPAATVRTPAVLAVRTGKPILCGTTWRAGGPLRYRGVIGEPIVPDPAAGPALDEARILREMNRQLEAFVRARPEEWNWIHPRWKTQPGQADAAEPAAESGERTAARST